MWDRTTKDSPLLVVLGLMLMPLTDPGPKTVRAQEAAQQPREFRSLGDLDADYDRRLAELEHHRITDLGHLASRKSGPEADAIYRELFLRAIAHGLTGEASPVAERCLEAAGIALDVRALATLVAAVADADRGQFDQALVRFRKLLGHQKRVGDDGQPSDPRPLLGAGEAFLRHLLRSARYEPARRLCSLLVDESGEPSVVEHFRSRLRLLQLVGRPAPPIDANDVDGRRVRLADLKGKVVLISFWASWCPPCLADFPRLNALEATYQNRGFEVLGVNVDAHHDVVKDVKSATPTVRHVLVHHGVTWPNVLNDGGGPGDIARAYGIEVVPANALVGRDGMVLGVEIGEAELEEVIVKALGDRPR
jgi:thiol-disulfide isomerase/thioredoxin